MHASRVVSISIDRNYWISTESLLMLMAASMVFVTICSCVSSFQYKSLVQRLYLIFIIKYKYRGTNNILAYIHMFIQTSFLIMIDLPNMLLMFVCLWNILYILQLNPQKFELILLWGIFVNLAMALWDFSHAT